MKYLHSILWILCSLLFVFCTDKTETSSVSNVTVLSVMSFNVKTSTESGTNAWNSRKEACLAMIFTTKPCLIGVQELTPAQKSYFDTKLTNYKSVGHARDGSGASTEYSAIYYRNDIFSVENDSTFWLSATPDFMSKGWDGACYRICTWAKLKLRDSENEFYFFNTHVDHKGTEAQKQSVILLKERIHKIAGDHAIVYLTGDFNMQPFNDNIINLSGYMVNLRDYFQDGSFFDKGTYNNWGSSNAIIDYIWYLNSNPVSYQVITAPFSGVNYISDHYPILGIFNIQYN